ncbi:MAG: hypothetical protein A2Y10_02790 [Planctomycetes bacterium GWF2_41_51]|nr:MAG: hypothetical protein A2Y10_02790 [Planctomycetes bacterium GWF2_41_51]HBG27477.1 hypothetical protein [Phycisphaerales bacterium]
MERVIQKFYDLIPSTTITARQNELEKLKNEKYFSSKCSLSLAPAPVAGEFCDSYESQILDIEMLVDWLDDLWQTDEEIRNSMTEEEFLNFRNSIKESAK